MVVNAAASESFTFTAAADSTVHAWVAEDVEIKSDWLSAGKYVGIAYTFAEGMEISASVTVTGVNKQSRFTIRFVVVSSEGAASVWEYAESETNVVTLSRDITVSAGDTAYVIIADDYRGADDTVYPQANYSIVYEEVASQA